MLQVISDPRRRMPLSCTRCLILGLVTLCLGVWGEVGNFSSCPQFFYKGHPPKGLGGEGCPQICQRYHNKYHFASLYHRERRTPLYSAYLFSAGGRKRPRNTWKYEPQLANSNAGPEMQPFPAGPVDQNVLESQAVPRDYFNSSYTKGHLSPNQHFREVQDKWATFTLTNIVPQKAGSNSGPWATLENTVHELLSDYCTGQAYIVTGVMPYASGRWIKNRVAVPEYLWSAYCCPSFNTSLPAHLSHAFPTYAAVGRNDPLSGEDIVPVNTHAKRSVRGYDVRRMPLRTMETYLQQRMGGPVSVFHSECSQENGGMR
ncbi:hypothetical protein MATL_G00198730 [Megalops atlanticus]|uniref:Endonuclease domain-containing 1 protein-like n=1 Tax=Megalops atlanticus TaxID=7932 RepID=A0A9D3PPN1_MEGAT|nr:hypothetical protein MATL_G00198730 [Megalops atlanticus]